MLLRGISVETAVCQHAGGGEDRVLEGLLSAQLPYYRQESQWYTFQQRCSKFCISVMAVCLEFKEIVSPLMTDP